MERHLRCSIALVFGLGIHFLLTTPSCADDIERSLQDHYRGKILVLRGFYAGEQLRYDASGALSQWNVGDWTIDGFVQVDKIQSSGQNLRIKARRLMVVSAGGKGFQFAGEEVLKKHKKLKKAALVEIEASLSTESITEENANAALARIFLNSKDQFADLVPAFWNPCVAEGISGKNEACRFSAEMVAVPGMNAPPQATTSSAAAQTPAMSPPSSTSASVLQPFKVGPGMKPPKPIFQPEPSFSEIARKAKFQGVVTLGLMVDKDGFPKNIHIKSPLGAGLDAQAVQTVGTWKFEPAMKDGQPVAVAVAVEVDFHLY